VNTIVDSEDDNKLTKVINKSFKLVPFVFMIVGLVCMMFAYNLFSKKVEEAKLGALAVKYLYNFSSIAELNSNMDMLKQITSDGVYQQLTIDNTDRTLSVYLKFKGGPVYVIPDKTTDRYVSYHLETKNISSSRKFVFFFEVDRGKVVSVRESEVIDFVGNPNPSS
jgi:hypothetical protein